MSKIDELKQQIRKLENELAIEEKKEKASNIECSFRCGDIYWWICRDGDVIESDWKDKCEDKYCVLFNHESSELVLNWYIYVQPFESFGCFKNREDAQRAIELFGDEIKRLYVEE